MTVIVTDVGPDDARQLQRQVLLAQAGQRLQSADALAAGDVVQIAVELTDKKTGSPFWWRRFAVVTDHGVTHHRWFTALTLKLVNDFERDLREVDVTKDVVTFVPNNRWPDGVAAMHMRLLHKGVIKIGS